MQDIQILFRSDESNEEEFKAANNLALSSQYINRISLEKSRMCINYESLVICRYSCLPYYDELERDIALRNSLMINTFKQHKYIADMHYVHDIYDMTPKTYTEWGNAPEGAYV